MRKRKVMTQDVKVGLAFDELANAIGRGPYNQEVELALNELRDELHDLGIDTNR
jgi:hypothetical protein